MISPVARGISRAGLDETFESSERRKSNLLLEARLLRDQGEDDAAAIRFAEAATIEEQLSESSAERGLSEKSWVHRFSAASCWAAAGNFYDALADCEALLKQPDLPERLRLSVSEYSGILRTRRAQWYSELERENAETEVAR
jgi:hypothetical protein